ncbi:metal ABC transporter substrate-binding protein [Bacillus songklensis]|uniref:Metal ABC transporter substrate-binding protein n=1 Tax=Bacillus songklensis TaxID=1069116 RepID=A0ABV8B6Q1_9BACI
MKRLAVFFTAVLVTALFLSGCSSSQTATESNDKKETNDQLTIYTTIFPLEDFAKKIGGDYVKVESIYPPNVDAHTFEPSQKTMVNIAQADAFIYTGAGLEGFVDKTKEALKNEKVKFVEAADGVTFIKGGHDHEEESHEEDHGEDVHKHESDEEHHDHGDFDPHVWLDPIRAITLAENIKNSLVELKPEQKETFEKNFETLKGELEQLDKELSDTVQKGKTKEIVVAHSAYGYWHDRYGLEQISIAGLSPENEPSQKELQAIIKDAREKNVKYVIFEQNVKPKIADIVKNELNAEPLTLHNLESITDEDIKNNEDYVSLMKRNIETLKKALN